MQLSPIKQSVSNETYPDRVRSAPFVTFWKKAGGFELKFVIEIEFLQSFLNYNRKLQNRINSNLGEG